MQRRDPRHVVWPFRLLWLPLLGVGLPLLMRIDVDTTRVQEESWRVLVSLPSPAQWVEHPATFWPGLLLVAAGCFAYVAKGRAWGPAGLRAAMYGRLAAAAWVFMALAALATWRFEGLVAEVQEGMDWRFLAHLRTTWLDRVLLGFSLAVGIACWILSWGPWPGEAGSGQQQGSDEQGPAEPAG